MSDQAQYRVKRGQIRIPRQAGENRTFVNHGDFVHQGDLLPTGMFDETDIQSWLEDGRIERADVSAEMAQAHEAEIRARSKWSVNPAALVGKTFEEMIVMVSEIDPDYDTDTLEDEVAAVTLLTSGWDPRYAEEITTPRSVDRSEVPSFKLDQGVEGPKTRSMERSMSDDARSALTLAKEKAAADREAS